MKKFEHETFVALATDKEILKGMGDSGWELVSVVPVSWINGEDSVVDKYEYFFKREVK